MTKKWEEHRDVIISFYKEQHKPLHEVQKLMEEMHGFRASVRAYRSRFDRWKIHKYSRRRRQDISPLNDQDDDVSTRSLATNPPGTSALNKSSTMTPPPTPTVYPAQRRLAAQPVQIQQPYFYPHIGSGYSPATTESASSSPVQSPVSQTSSILHQTVNLEFDSSQTNHQCLPFEGYPQRQQQQYPDPQYDHHLPGTSCLAWPLGADQTSMFSWTVPSYHLADATAKLPRN